MKAALCRSLEGSGAVTVEDVPEPQAGPGQAVLRVTAAALNFFDTLITKGRYQEKPELPFSPAGEVAGVVTAAGPGVPEDLLGTRMTAYIGWGGAREKVAVDWERLVPIPPGVADETAAGLGIAYGTAVHAFRDRARLAAGETVAVLGAAGGAGLAAVEAARLMGARVIAAASSAEKLALCREHGADILVDSRAADLKQALREATAGRGVDVVYDCVGGAGAEAALRATAWEGRYLVIGFASGEIPRIPLNLLLLRGAAAVGVFWGEFVRRAPERHRANMREILGWAAAGRISVHIHRVFPLDGIREALGVIERREATGKVLVAP